MIAKPAKRSPLRATATLVDASAMLFSTRRGVQLHSSPCSIESRDSTAMRGASVLAARPMA